MSAGHGKPARRSVEDTALQNANPYSSRISLCTSLYLSLSLSAGTEDI